MEKFALPQIKWYIIPSKKDIVDELRQELPNNLGLRHLDNWKVLEKFQRCVKVETSTQYLI